MSPLTEHPRLPDTRDPKWAEKLNFQLTYLLADANRAVNLLTGGRMSVVLALPSAPTTGLWGLGDEVRNDNPQELGTAGSKYVLRGWICVAAGEPGAWKEQRTLTGN